MSSEISLYFHIPFCKRKCDYCHFYVIPEKDQAKEQLLEGFELELDLVKPLLKHKKVSTIYFGGGTPSLFGPSRLSTLLEIIKNTCHILPSAEITLEANPENVTIELMEAYASVGINRTSIGIQTLDEHLLKLLGRLHSPKTALQAILDTHQAGIKNISIDLMYDLPKQKLCHWTSTLYQIKLLPLTHLSLYNLTIEPHTQFFKNKTQLRQWLPDEETSLEMYEKAIEILPEMGFNQYEISAFAQPGYESQHNTGYWTGRSFLGLGPSAFSYWQGKRFRNVANLSRYLQALRSGHSPIDFEEKLSPEACLRELFVINLRLINGVDLDGFIQRHGLLDPSTLANIETLIEQDYIHRNKDRIKLTKKGILFYDTVASELI